MSNTGKNFSNKVKEKAIELGASVVGIADVGRFDEAPEDHKSTDILEDATAVISMGVTQPKAVIQRATPTQYTRTIFTTAGICDGIASQVSIWIENQGFDAIPISAPSMYMDALSSILLGDLSHKHTAMLAGLGETGLNSLLINPTYGTRLKLVSVVTNAPVQADSPFSESLWPHSECMKCVTACPVKAISSFRCDRQGQMRTILPSVSRYLFRNVGPLSLSRMQKGLPGAAGTRENVSDAVERFCYRQIDPRMELSWLMLTGLKE